MEALRLLPHSRPALAEAAVEMMDPRMQAAGQRSPVAQELPFLDWGWRLLRADPIRQEQALQEQVRAGTFLVVEAAVVAAQTDCPRQELEAMGETMAPEGEAEGETLMVPTPAEVEMADLAFA